MVAVFAMAIGALVVRRLDRRGEQMGALLVTAFTGPLVSPVSWTHHWVWVAPLAGFLLRRVTLWSVTALGVLFTVFTGWQFRMAPSGAKIELHWSPPHMLLGNAYVLAALVFTPVIATLALRGRGRRAEVLAGTASRR